MSKLGYIWYPKDWGNSEAVFELNLEQRGLYRELIDLAMFNDNKTIIKLSTWSRKFGVSDDCLKSILGQLSHLDLIEIDGENLFIPSCEKRLVLVRAGSKGGKKSKPPKKPISKPLLKPNQKQIEKKEKEKEKRKEREYNINEINNQTETLNALKSFLNLTDERLNSYLEEFKIPFLSDVYDEVEFKDRLTHFINWVKIKVKNPEASKDQVSRIMSMDESISKKLEELHKKD